MKKNRIHSYATPPIFEGNKKIKTPQLKKTIKIKAGDMLNYGKLSEGIAEVRRLYEARGFTGAKIDYRVEKGASAKESVVKVIVEEKERMRIKSVTITGNETIRTGQLKKGR